MAWGPAKYFGGPPFFSPKALQNDPRNINVSAAAALLQKTKNKTSPDNGSLNLTKGLTTIYKKQSSVSSVPFCDRASQFAQQQPHNNNENDVSGVVKKGKGRSRPGKKERAALKEVKSAVL